MAHVMRESRELWAARFLSHLGAAISATPTTRKVHDHDIRKTKKLIDRHRDNGLFIDIEIMGFL